MKKSKWIWYYGDFEIFHSAKLHSLRQEQGTTFPGFWSLANTYPIVRFSKTVNTRADDTITLYLNGVDQSFGYTWDAEGFAVYVASQYYDEYKNANASNWQRCVVKTGILFTFDPANKPFTEN